MNEEYTSYTLRKKVEWVGGVKNVGKKDETEALYFIILFTICFLISYSDEKLHPRLIPLFVEDRVYWRDMEYRAGEMIVFHFLRAKRFLRG